MSKRNFITQVQSYGPTDPPVDSNCADILFFNDTLNTVFIDGFPVAAGGVLSIETNEDETNTTKYSISFGAGNTGSVYVIRKKYTT